MNKFKMILLAGAIALPLSGIASAADIDPPMPSQADASQMGMYLRADMGWSMLKAVGKDDHAFTGDFGVGYKFSDYMRADLTGEWAGKYKTTPGTTLSTTAIMGNAYFDIANDSIFTPYVGVGAGYGWVHGSGATKKDSGLVLGAAAGVAVDLTNNLAVDVGYKVRDFAIAGKNPIEHSVSVGLRFTF